MRRLPACRSTTRPASFSTLRCCETAGRLTGSSRASSPTARGRSATRSKIVRLVGSPSAVSPSTAVTLAITYVSLDLRCASVKGAIKTTIRFRFGTIVRMDLELHAIGTVESPLTDPAAAPKQGDEGAPDAWLVFDASALEALEGLAPGDEVLVLTWLDRARRDLLPRPPARSSSGRQLPCAAGRVRHALPPPAQPDRTASRPDPRHRRRARACERPRGARWHADRRRQAGAERRGLRALINRCRRPSRARASDRRPGARRAPVRR